MCAHANVNDAATAEPQSGPTLVCLIGPSAVGKLTVGQALCARTGFRLFHGHIVADALSPLLPIGSPAFRRISDTWRRTFFKEAAAAGLDVVTTVAWRFDVPADTETIAGWLAPYRAAGRVCCIVLTAPLPVRMARNRTANRRQQKNAFWVTDDYLQQTDATHRYASDSTHSFPFDVPHLQLDISTLPAEAAAEQIISTFRLTSAQTYD